MALEASGTEQASFVPGTVLLIDDTHEQSTKHATGKHMGIVLIPPPSDDPNDPLNWSPARKRQHLILLCVYTFFMNGLINFYGVAYDGLAPDLGTTIDGLNMGSAILFLFTGVGAAFWQPVAMKIGRRPVYIIGLLIAMVGSIVGAVQTSLEVWVTFNVFWGLGCGPKEGLPQISLQDTYFAHQMGSKVGYWALSYSAGAFVIPLVAGYVYVDLGWRWCFWITAIGFVAMAVTLFFGLEETLYPRSYNTPQNAQPLESNAASLTEIYSQGTEAACLDPSIQLKTYWKTHPLHSWGVNPNKSWHDLFLRPYQLALFPPVLWAGVFTGVSICWWAAIFTTESQFFTGPPYHWSGEKVGLTNVPALIGSILGTLFAGNVSDWFIIVAARRNNGIREPEHRLILLALTAIITSGGLVMYGKGVEVGIHWTCPVFGMGLMAFGFTASSIIGETYILDSYRAVAPESLVLINIFRNLIGMTFVFTIQPWLIHSGYGNAYIQMMVMGLVAHLTVIPMMIWGKRLRAMTAGRYLRMVEASGIPREFA
ncbi:major facilitator superfamily domain-containing protein [Aspergillus alliaceus]|uniref:major facilitator superfamily domain-containing protein n=1 Tax=Petromyces alliaceus TaxID=209559 RepID=UPI0012A4B555|nr:major facilitator superfamily domain-containing protein [Aspergillus alliaceus]KAB8234173.1 major facilitator superfamily domain-containing protein [Aspergillus alliaceus]